MAKELIQSTIMFADVAGSTALYDRFGNTKAKKVIENGIKLMTDATVGKNGMIIKTIGDEVMCRFPTASDCMKAAIEIQEKVKNIAVGTNEIRIKIRIGLHAGEAILENNDVFGDTVNIAARMAGIAKADQIITTEDTYHELSEDLKILCRKYDTTSVKGKARLMTIYDVMWDEDVTRISYSSAVSLSDKQITLVTRGSSCVLQAQDMPITIGRDKNASILLNTQFVSRIHVKIDYNRGKFVLIDQSTNGTYVQINNSKEVFLRREDLPLSSSGSIALGEKIETCDTIISFKIE